MFLKCEVRTYRTVVSTINHHLTVATPHAAAWTLLLALCSNGFGVSRGTTDLNSSPAVSKIDSSRVIGVDSTPGVSNFGWLNGIVSQPLVPMPLRTDFDFDGDLRADVSTWRPADGTWHVSQSSTSSGGTFSTAFGVSNDIPVPADYDGDGRADVAVLRSSISTWFIQNSSDGQFVTHQFGLSDDIPVPADYDGDSRANIAVFRPSDGMWYVRRPDGSFFGNPFGTSGDMLVPADYDGDGDSDFGVYRPSDGNWYTLQRVEGCSGSRQPDCNPQPRDKVVVANLNRLYPTLDSPVPADYDGDQKADFALWREGIWIIMYSSDGTTHQISQGIEATNNVPLPLVYIRQSR